MSIPFNADEILAIAERIEKNGGIFYRAATLLFPEAREPLTILAKQEDAHMEIFSAMRKALEKRATEPVVFDPDQEGAAYLNALADRRVFDVSKDPETLFGPNPTLAHVFQTAVGLEKESIVFYTGMRNLVSPRMGQDKVDAIIQEEWRHIGVINQLADQFCPKS